MKQGEQEVIKKILPNLVNFVLFHKNYVYEDIDFFFDDEPSVPHGISCFTPGSNTSEKLITVCNIIIACKDIKEREEVLK